MIKKIGYYIRKPGYYLFNALQNPLLRLFTVILAFKLAFFTYITEHPIETFFSSFGIILAVISFSVFIKRNILMFLFLYVINCFFSILFFIHVLYLSYFGDFASIYHIKMIHQLGEVSDIVINMIDKEILFIVDLIFLPLLLFRIKKIRNNIIPEKKKVFGFMLLLCLLFNIYPAIYHARFSHNYFESIYYRDDFIKNMGFITYQITDIYYFLLIEGQRVRITSSDFESVREWKRQNKVKGENELTGIGKGMNLIIIQVESLQNFVIGKSYNSREITPNLNRLAKEGIYFKNIYDQTAAGNTSDATLLANSSLYPSRKGAASYLYFQNCFDSLPKVLKENGYTTATLHAYKKNFWNSEAFEKGLGFQHQFYGEDYLITDIIGSELRGLSDKSFFSQSSEKIKQLQSPFYVFIRTLSTHAPFAHITSDLDNFPIDNLNGKTIGHYMKAMHYIDSAIGEFLNMLYKNHLRDNTIMVIYGDHRARLSLREMRQVGINDVKEYRKIPLIIYLPNKRLGIESSTIGGLIDVTPTICNILGIDISDKFFLGKDLTNSDKSYVIFRDGKYISHNKSMNKINAQKQLMISDLILEKDMVPLIKKNK